MTYTALIDSNGEIFTPGMRVQRVKPNKNGNRPVGVIVWIDYPGGMVNVKFADGNTRPTSPGVLGLRFVETARPSASRQPAPVAGGVDNA